MKRVVFETKDDDVINSDDVRPSDGVVAIHKDKSSTSSMVLMKVGTGYRWLGFYEQPITSPGSIESCLGWATKAGYTIYQLI